MEPKKVYIGDSVYCHFDGFHIWLETNNGMGPDNEIALEWGIFMRLIEMSEQYWNIKIKISKEVPGGD